MTLDIHCIQDAIHGQISFVYPDEDLIFVWNRNSMVNVYNGAFEPLDCFSLSQKSKDENEVIESIEQYLKETAEES